MQNLRPREHQLLADLERAFANTSFVLSDGKWMDFDKTSSLAAMDGDVASIERLVKAKKIKNLGTINGEPHYTIWRD
jgi:hypothetical protein